MIKRSFRSFFLFISLSDKKKPQTLLKLIERSILIIFLSLSFLSLTFVAYFGLNYELNKLTGPVHAVTVSIEGPAAEMHPESMGHYKLFKGVHNYSRSVYKHVDRDDRFILYDGEKLQGVPKKL